MMDYTQLYKLLGAATCSYAEHGFEYHSYYPSANDDAIRDIAVSFIVDNHKEIMRIPKEKLYKELCAVPDKKFLKLKNNLYSAYGDNLYVKYWEKGRDINLGSRDGAYIIYDRTNSETDVEYEHFFHELVFKPNWDFIYDTLTYNFSGKPAEEEPIIFGHWESKPNKEQAKYCVEECLHWLGCLWSAGGSPTYHGVHDGTLNINKKYGIRYMEDTYFWTWQQMVKKSDGHPATWPSYDQSDDSRYWKYIEWYIKYFLKNPAKKHIDIFEFTYFDWHIQYERALLNTVIDNGPHGSSSEPVNIFVGLNDVAKTKMDKILKYVDNEIADGQFKKKFNNQLYYNKDKGIVIYSKDDATAERIRSICKN